MDFLRHMIHHARKYSASERVYSREYDKFLARKVTNDYNYVII